MTAEDKLTKREETLPEETRTDRQRAPFVDIYENQDEILLMADMPGVGKDDLQVRVEKDVLYLEGRKTFEAPQGLINCEIEPCTYVRSFSLPKTMDGDKIQANLEQDVLSVHLPKRESVKPRQIQVTSG